MQTGPTPLMSPAEKQGGAIKVFAVIFLVKLFFLSDGINVQPDSANYLECVSHYDYPAVYPLFLRLIQQFTADLWWVGFVQILLFAVAGAWFVGKMTSYRTMYYALAAVLAVEPMSGFLLSSIMSEGLYLSFLLIWLGVWFKQTQQPEKWVWVVATGAIAGVLYATRFSALFVIVVPILWWLLKDRKAWRMWLWQIPLYVVSFQIILLPFRMHQHKIFDTYTLNALAGSTIWSNAAVLYPGSQVQEHPENAFEHFLDTGTYVDAFETDYSLHSSHIWNHNLPYRRFTETAGYTYQNQWQSHAVAGATGWRLVREQPLGYITAFVFPNIASLYTRSEYVDSFSTEAIRHQYHLPPKEPVRYQPYYWMIAVILLLMALALAIHVKFSDYRFWQWSFVLLVLLFVMPVFAPMTLRYCYTYTFLIGLMLVVLLVNREENKLPIFFKVPQ